MKSKSSKDTSIIIMVSTITKRAIVIFVVLCMATFLPILHFNAYIKTLKAISASTDDDDNFIYMNTKKDSVTDTETIDDDDDDDNDDNDDKEGDEEIPSSSSSSACSTFKNSEEWLNGPRHSNINETLMTDEYIQQLILHNSPSDSYSNNGAKDILSQSVCLPNSTFLNWDYAPKVTSPSSNQPREVIETLASRLMFLAIHEHQFGPARLEAMARYNKDKICNDDNDHKKYMASLQIADVGRFDYECPDTKYLISNIPRDGFGASLRVGMVDPMFIGLVTNRTVLYVTSLEDSYDVESQFKTPWPLASCPRKDMQCVYMPFSPCVLTKKDIDNGLSLPTENLESARSKGYFGDGYDDAKVLMMTSDSARHKPTPKLLMSKFVSIIQSFYEDASSSGTTGKTLAGWEFDQETLSKVYQFLKDEPAWLPHQITSLYLMRPNMESRKQVENAMQKILPENFDPSKTVGFPIRGRCFHILINVFLLSPFDTHVLFSILIAVHYCTLICYRNR